MKAGTVGALRRPGAMGCPTPTRASEGTPPRRRLGLSGLILCVLALAGLPAPATAQIGPAGPSAPVTPDVRIQRFLAVGNLAFPAVRRPSLTAGALWQLSLSPIRTVMEDGMQVRRPPSWYLHTLATGGLSFDSDPSKTDPAVGIGAFGQVGVVRRIDPSMVSSAGVALQAMLGPRGIGPVLRVELLDNIGIQLGWMTFANNERKDGLFLSIDALRCILEDLGLGPCLTGE